MKTLFIILLSIFTIVNINSQSSITGTVTDSKGMPIVGASVYLENTYDGGFTDKTGKFYFQTDEFSNQTLIVSFISYKPFKLTSEVNLMNNVKVTLKEAINELKAVTITAGTFETGDNSKTAVLDPIEVVTTAGAEAGDINSAIKTLPGVQTVGEDGRLFVRGGDANETRIFIDGMRVFKPYVTTNTNTPTRSRFSSFLFKGVAFSSGGFSSEFGDALSGVLSMNTIDFPNQSKTDINVMSLGLGLGKTKKWKKDAISLSLGYINLGPYKGLFPDSFEWVKPYSGFSGESVYRHKFKNGMLKFYTGASLSNAIINRYNVDYDSKVESKVKNDNIYMNSTYKGSINKKLAIFGGISYSIDKAILGFNDYEQNVNQQGLHAKTKLTYIVSERTKVSVGAEMIQQNLKSLLPAMDENIISGKQYASFTEAKYLFSQNFVAKLGFRGEYSDLLKKWNIAPRLSLAYKLGEYSQVSLAAGKYFQMPNVNYLSDNQLTYENTDQYILNYSYKKSSRILRTEVYYKKYNDLLLFNNNAEVTNKGNGYSKGIEIFWKDKKTFKFIEYWLSYSLLDAKKQYKNYPNLATPNSASTHNLSLVVKYWIGSLRSYPGITYNYSSSRPYNNPNSTEFMAEKTKPYHNLSLTWSYLISQQKIFFVSASNILGFKNEYGYQYSQQPGENGIHRSSLINPPATRSFFVGFFWTISDDNNANQLDRL